jgi:hypothetical protein
MLPPRAYLRSSGGTLGAVNEAFATSAEFFAECATVHRFLVDRVHPLFAHAGGTPDADVVAGMYLRAEWWLRTVGKLDEPQDLQAAVAACRALFELASDAVLVRHAGVPCRASPAGATLRIGVKDAQTGRGARRFH